MWVLAARAPSSEGTLEPLRAPARLEETRTACSIQGPVDFRVPCGPAGLQGGSPCWTRPRWADRVPVADRVGGSLRVSRDVGEEPWSTLSLGASGLVERRPGPNLRLKTLKSFLVSQRVGLWPPGCQPHTAADRSLTAGPATSAHRPPHPPPALPPGPSPSLPGAPAAPDGPNPPPGIVPAPAHNETRCPAPLPAGVL